MNGSVNFDGTLSGSISAGGGGGGSTVVITPVVTEGTKIADVTVDGAEKDLYCPTVTPTEVTVTQVQESGTKIASIDVDGQSVDLYAPTPSTPTEVTVTQVQESGTKIATIGVNGVETDIYAPYDGSVEYSTDEQIIGIWIDGKPLYRRTWNFSSPVLIGSNAWADTVILVSSTHIYNIIGCDAVSDAGAKWDFIGATTDLATTTYVRLLNVRNTAIYVKYLTLIYTKTTDYDL